MPDTGLGAPTDSYQKMIGKPVDDEFYYVFFVFECDSFSLKTNQHVDFFSQ